MDKATIVKLICELNDFENLTEKSFQNQIDKICANFVYGDEDILKNDILTVDTAGETVATYEWKHLCINFYLLHLLNIELSKEKGYLLSVKETKELKDSIQTLISYGIQNNLQPNLPYFKSSYKAQLPDLNLIIYRYTLLKHVAVGLNNCLTYPNLRVLILPNFLKLLLVAAFQIGYCPLRKPTEQDGLMTDKLYSICLQDQMMFKNILDDMTENIHPTFFVKDVMMLFEEKTPMWFKKAISRTLTKIMRSKEGIQHITLAMMDGVDNDTTKTWRMLDILTKLILSCRKCSDFEDNICGQLFHLLRLVKSSDLFIFERLVASCTKCLYTENEELCRRVFVERLITLLLCFSDKEHKFRDDDDITADIKQTVRLVHDCFTVNAANSTSLPIHLLRRFINVIFYFYHITINSSFLSTNKQLKEILITYLRKCDKSELSQIMDNFLFGFTVSGIPQFRNDLIVEVNEKIIIKNTSHLVINATADVMQTFYDLLSTEQKVNLFGYLLTCVSNKEKYFSAVHNSKSLLFDEEQASSIVFQRLLTVHKLLSQLSENKEVQRSLKSKPDDIIHYIKTVLCSEQNNETLFVVVMILDNLLLNTSRTEKYSLLSKPLTELGARTTNIELKLFCEKLLCKLKNSSSEPDSEKTDFDKALEDVFDPLLPTRGHGLLVLSKLIEKRDKQAMARKQYLLNLFQLHLKDTDSFIYLNAINGMAGLADEFTDTVLNVLCQEYADFSKKDDGVEIRMKLGEVLVRVVKLLGDMASKYKSVLLNTFLSATKDDDHLIRSSSLSNLGEVCRVLSYNLGTIITEVLVCVHAIITTDKAVEARRAAITVLKQLFIGLQSEMLNFLKEEILPIYRTLKDVYYNDKDDVMRLQAQLALEELNENMKIIVFPNQQLHFEKKIILLD